MRAFFSTPVIVGFTWLAMLSSSAAESVPSFSLEYSAANATHVVVVDAAGTVLESWRGDVAPGKTIDGAVAGRPETVADPFPRDGRKPNVAAITGARRVLFLTRSQGGRAFLGASQPDHVLRLATVWIEENQCFAVYQLHNPGSGAQMLPLQCDEATLKATVTRGMEAFARSVPVARESSDSDLAGEWRVFLPAGFEHRIKISRIEVNRYRLEPASLNFGGVYDMQDRRFTSVEPEDSPHGRFVWQIRSPHLITLVEQTGSHGSDYTGAVLFRPKTEALIEEF